MPRVEDLTANAIELIRTTQRLKNPAEIKLLLQLAQSFMVKRRSDEIKV